jgi:prephenate dehydrogenase
MQKPLFRQIAIVGVGLLGGSVGMAVKRRHLCQRVIGIGRSKMSLEEARRLEAIDEGFDSLEEGIADADLIVLCTPVKHILSVLPEVAKFARPGAIITDVGSTKESIVKLGEECTQAAGKFFVGAHPMAGSEKSGMRFARPDLYANATCYVTRTVSTSPDAFVRVSRFWRELGSRVVIIRPGRHDHLTSLVSHLPHLLAVALVKSVEASLEDKNLIKGIIGNGFRDTTRIACGSPEMWEDIFSDNCRRVSENLAAVEKAIHEIVQVCQENGSNLKPILEHACGYREFINQR